MKFNFLMDPTDDIYTSIGTETPLLMYFGGAKPAKMLKRGDILMLTNSQPSIVISIESKYDIMHTIVPDIGDSFVIGENQTITCYNGSTDRTISIKLEEYLLKDIEWKRNYQLVQYSVSYQRSNVKNDPYLIGLLVAKYANTIEETIKFYLLNKLDSLSNFINTNDLKSLNLSDINNGELDEIYKSGMIPDVYLYNARESRVRLLQGIVAAQKKPNRSRSRSLDRDSKRKVHNRSASMHYQKSGRSLLAKSNIKLEEKKTVHKRSISRGGSRTNSPRGAKKSNKLSATQELKFTNNSSKKLNVTDTFTPVRNKSLIPVLRKSNDTVINVTNNNARQIEDLIRGLGYSCIRDGNSITIVGYGDDPKLVTTKFKTIPNDNDKSINIQLSIMGNLMTSGYIGL